MKTRNGFVSNSSSSSFIIGNNDIAKVATKMLDIVIKDWSDWRGCTDQNKKHYQEWRNNLKKGLQNEEVQAGIIGITLPSTNYDTYMVKKDGEVYITTANNHDWSDVEDIKREGDGDDDERDEVALAIRDLNFFNVRNGLIHSHEKYEDLYSDKIIKKCPDCDSSYGQYVVMDGKKICGVCYKTVFGKDKEIKVKKVKTKSISLTNREIEELINGLGCSYDQSTEKDAIIAQDLRAKLEKMLKEKYDA